MAQPAESRHQTKRTAGGKRLRLGAKLRNASFVALLLGALVVCDTVALTTLAQPQESPSRYIVLENRTSAQPVALSARAIVSGSFQTSLEESISDALPFKSEAALESAALQRAFIDASARLFGFSIHPTYYGSQHAYSADQDAVIPFPTLVTDELAATLAKGAQAMGSAAAANPTLGVFYYAPPHLADLASNPLISYTPPIDLAKPLIRLSKLIFPLTLSPSGAARSPLSKAASSSAPSIIGRYREPTRPTCASSPQ